MPTRPSDNPGKGNNRGAGKSAARSGCAVFGWVFLVVSVLGVGYFMFRVWDYSQALRRGELVAPPTYAFQVTRDGVPTLKSDLVTREVVEAEGRPSFGPANAELVVVMFGDFECPYCKTVAPAWRRMMNKYGDKVRFVYRHYPLTEVHPQAQQAAEASECALEQGRFWAYHDKIYFNPGDITTSQLALYADQLGLDRRQFDRCLTDRRYQAQVNKDLAAAKQAGVSGTPTFFFNGQRIEGAIPESVFDNILGQLVR
jgi:protein-disulfide isomerase